MDTQPKVDFEKMDGLVAGIVQDARTGEVISPAGFEHFFRELAEVFGSPDLSLMGELCGRYGLDLDPSTVPGLCERFGLTHPLA